MKEEALHTSAKETAKLKAKIDPNLYKKGRK